ncbi:SIMPL domain-containing protein [Bremerella sp. JC817]|uniref:SIMPL domain-containing protein n=1 Tax=Bremerella sp. JC817 TaxID=3231756 RepID=UPI0034574C94
MRTAFLKVSAVATVACLLLVSGPQSTFGEEARLLRSNGTSVIKRLPQELVVTIEFLARDKSVKEAVAKLESRKKTAEGLLKTLDANMESMQFTMPSTSNRSSQKMEELQAMFQENVRRSGSEMPEGLKLPKSVNVSSTLTVRWPLPEGSPTELLLVVSELKQKIEEADIASTKDEEPNLAEQEMMAEAEAMGYSSYRSRSSEEVEPGTPKFSFRCQLADEDRQQGLKDAFKKARASAEELASAAGMKVARLSNLESNVRGASVEMNEYYGYPGGYGRGMGMPSTDDGLTAESPLFGELEFHFSVGAAFEMVAAPN